MATRPAWALSIIAPALVVGTLATGIVYRVARAREAARAEVAFTTLADMEAMAVEKKLAVALESLYALRSFFHGSEHVTADEFRSFTSALRARHGILQALEWIPRVFDTELRAHEISAKQEGIQDYRITQLSDDGRLIPAAGRSVYYPVRYLDPLDGQKIALGFDLGSEEKRRSTLERAAAQLKPIVSKPLELVQGANGTAAFIAALPMERFAADRPADYMAGSFVLAVISFQNSTIFSDLSDDAHFAAITLSTLNGNQWLPLLQWLNANDGDAHRSVTSHHIEFGGQAWRLEMKPTRAFMKAARTPMPAVLASVTAGLWILLIGGGLLQLRLSQEISRRRHSRILDSVLATVDEGIVVADPNGHLLFVNEAARRFVGSVDDSIPVSQWPERLGAFHTDGKTLFSPTELPLVRAIHGEVVPTTEVFVKNAATPRGAWVTVTGKPLIDETGEPKGGVVVIQDHTQEKLSQATVDRLAQAVESTKDPVFITDRAGSIEYVNEAFHQVTGFCRDEAIGHTPRMLKSGEHDDAFYKTLWSKLLDGKDQTFTVTNRTKSGRLFTAEETITPMRDANGAVTHFVAVLKDMTEILRRREQEVELRLAAQVQKRLYPQEPPAKDGWDMAGMVLPAEETCGDYYDFIELDNGTLALVVGDVSGHGLGPALVMSEVRALLRSTSGMFTDPAQILQRVNQTLHGDLEVGTFVTMLLATLDTKSGNLQWINAGHPSGYVVAADGTLRAELKSEVIPLGILPRFASLNPHEIHLDPGDVLMMVTDGVTEWGEGADDPFGQHRALDVLREKRQLPAAQIAESLMGVLHAFSDVEQSDDLTLIVCKRC